MKLDRFEELLALMRAMRVDVVRTGEPDPDYLPRVDAAIRGLELHLNPPAPLAPSRLGFMRLAENEWHLTEGKRVAPFRSSLLGLRIAHEAFQHANDTSLPPLPPELFCDGLAPRQSVDKALRVARELVEKDYRMRWLASEIANVKVRTHPGGQQFVQYLGDKAIDTTEV